MTDGLHLDSIFLIQPHSILFPQTNILLHLFKYTTSILLNGIKFLKKHMAYRSGIESKFRFLIDLTKIFVLIKIFLLYMLYKVINFSNFQCLHGLYYQIGLRNASLSAYIGSNVHIHNIYRGNVIGK